MDNAARWRDWRPDGRAKTVMGSAIKPSKPSKPLYSASPEQEIGGSNLKEMRPAAPPLPTVLNGMAGVAAEVAPFARIGSAVLSGGPTGSPPMGFDGFEFFVADPKRKTVLEASVGTAGSVTLRPAAMHQFPEPTGFKTVPSGVGSDEVRYTVVHHHIKGANRFGEKGVEFPICLLNLAAWRRGPFDLRLARWLRDERAAMGRFIAPTPTPMVSTASTAMFASGVQIELRRESGNRWLMWEVRSGRRNRRSDFASPSLEHAQRTARHWYGEPATEWAEMPELPQKQEARRRRRT